MEASWQHEIAVSFEQSFPEETSFVENECSCWATGEGRRKKFHGTTETLPSSKQSSGSRITENIFVLKLGIHNSGFLQKNPVLFNNSQRSKETVWHNLGLSVAMSLYPGTLAAPYFPSSQIPHSSKPFHNRTALSYLLIVTRHSTASR